MLGVSLPFHFALPSAGAVAQNGRTCKETGVNTLLKDQTITSSFSVEISVQSHFLYSMAFVSFP